VRLEDAAPLPCVPCELARSGEIRFPDVLEAGTVRELLGEAAAFGAAMMLALGAERVVPALCGPHRVALETYVRKGRS
jgi:hypothetical protein